MYHDIFSLIVAPGRVNLQTKKNKLTVTLRTAGDPSILHSYFCLGESRPDKGLVPLTQFFPGCSIHSLFLRSEHTLM